MVEGNKTLLTVYGVIDQRKTPATYAGVIELPESGYTSVVVLLPYGVRHFPSIPYQCFVLNSETYVEFRKGMRPAITINYWESIN